MSGAVAPLPAPPAEAPAESWLDRLYAPVWSGGWAATRLVFGVVSLWSMLARAPALADARADVSPFAVPLVGARAPVVRAFRNLGGDATLVVPAPSEDPRGYPHLAAFLRAAPRAQAHALWQTVGGAVETWLLTRGRTVWVSTAGLGVSWLHVRLDTRPKYVKWPAYRVVPYS